MAFAANELFRSIANGNWNSTSTWEMSTNGGSLWFAATSTPTNLSSTITINNTVTVTENVTADQIILSGGSDLSIASGITLTYPGNGGSILVSGNSISGAGTFRIEGSFFLDLRPNGVFSAGLRVASGTIIATSGASPYIGRLYGPVTVDSGAILSPSMTGNVIVYALEIYGNVINNGTLTAGGGNNTNRNKYIRFKGEEFVNNGAVTVFTIILDTNTTISGAGTFTPYRIYIDSNGSVTMLSDMTFSPGNDFHFISGGTLNPNGYTLNFTSATLTLNSGSTITNSGLIRTQNTVNLNLRAGSNFNAPLNVNTGLTNATDFSSPYVGRLYGPVTVDAGATLAPTLTGNVIVYGLEIYGNVINNGTLTAGGGNNTNLNKYIIFKGGEFVNNGTVSVFTISLDTNINISGAGTFTPYRIYVGANGNATMLSDMTFSPALELHFISGGMLNPNGNTLNFTSGTLQLNNGAIIANSGLFRTQNTVNLNLRAGSNFNAPLRVSSGLTNATDYSTPYVGRLYGPVTVDTGATLAPTMTGGTIVYHLEYYGNVTNNGTLTAGGFNNTQFLKSMRFKCPVFVNNGLLSVLTVNLDTNLTLSGTGSFTTNVNILSNRNVTLTSDHQFSSAIINSGSTFTISNSRAKFTASNPILQNGSFITTNSKVEYNGTVLQTISSANINYNGLIINNPAGAILTGSFTIPDTLSFISGDLNLNGNNITFMPDAYLNETPGNLVFGNTGFLVTTRTLGAPSALNVAGFGALLTSSSSLGSTEIKRGHTVQNGLNGGTSIKRYYDITPANNTGLNASL
ncbi:MAG: hypothetical protein KDD00_04565, partial [Ignavibacteriae bacterium]|nr:hypothetical protein [Ignavibacteriota bacterium]